MAVRVEVGVKKSSAVILTPETRRTFTHIIDSIHSVD